MHLSAIALGAALVAASAVSDGAPRERPSKPETILASSIGSPNEGRLDGGKRLPQAPYMRVVPFYAESAARWGMPTLVSLIDRAARRVARQYPDAVLSVGDLSRREGGELLRHHSHESGRDADLGFYVRNGKNKQLLHDRFVTFSARGPAADVQGAVFDDARNWALVEALVEDATARISYIFVASHIRARLLRYADAHGVSRDVRRRAADLMTQPRTAAHDDHFHIRIACPTEQPKCVEQAVLRTARLPNGVVRIRLRGGAEHTLPELPPSVETHSISRPLTSSPHPYQLPLSNDHVGRRTLSKDVEADNLDH